MRSELKLFQAIFVLIGSFLFFVSSARAASFILVDWRVDNYAPDEYRLNARTPALPGSTVFLSVYLLQDKGKGVYQPVDLSNLTIRWLAQGYKISETKGVNRLSYTINKFTDETSLNLAVQIVDDNLGTVAQRQLSIPIFQSPEISFHRLENNRVSPYHQEVFAGAPGQEIALVVKPYFFNVSTPLDLNLQWYHRLEKITTGEKDKFVFRAKLPQNPVKDLFSVFVQNAKAELEFVKENFYLTNK